MSDNILDNNPKYTHPAAKFIGYKDWEDGSSDELIHCPHCQKDYVIDYDDEYDYLWDRRSDWQKFKEWMGIAITSVFTFLFVVAVVTQIIYGGQVLLDIFYHIKRVIGL